MFVKLYFTAYSILLRSSILRVKTKNKKAMLEYAKVILPKVSFSKELFRKELQKCIQRIEIDQIEELYLWCYKNFKNVHPNVLAEAFANVAA